MYMLEWMRDVIEHAQAWVYEHPREDARAHGWWVVSVMSLMSGWLIGAMQQLKNTTISSPLPVSVCVHVCVCVI